MKEKGIMGKYYGRGGFNTINKVKPILTKEQTFKKLEELDMKYIEQFLREKKLKRLAK